MPQNPRNVAVMFHDHNLAEGIQSLTLRHRRNNAQTTVITNPAHKYIHTVGDGMMTIRGIFEADDDLDDAFKDRQNLTSHTSVVFQRTTVGSPAYTGQAIVSGYGESAPYRDAVQIDTDLQATDGWRRGNLLARQQLRSPWHGTTWDRGASFNGNVRTTLHLTDGSFVGAGFRVLLQHSPNGTTWSNFQQWNVSATGVLTDSYTSTNLGRYLRVASNFNCTVTAVAVFTPA